MPSSGHMYSSLIVQFRNVKIQLDSEAQRTQTIKNCSKRCETVLHYIPVFFPSVNKWSLIVKYNSNVDPYKRVMSFPLYNTIQQFLRVTANQMFTTESVGEWVYS